MEMLGRVRRMYFRDNLNRSEIARLTGLSRNTVKKWLKAEGQVAPAYHPAGHPNSSSKVHSNSPTLIGL
jgi:transposase